MKREYMNDETAKQGKKEESVITVLLEHGLRAGAVIPGSQGRNNSYFDLHVEITVF